MSEASGNGDTIVVGFDGSDGARRALDWAVEEARFRGWRVRAVRAWSPGEFGTDEEMAQIAAKNLASEVAAAVGSDAGVVVDTVTERGSAGKILIQQSDGEEMLVVGSRGHGGFAGLLLGSVGQQVITHAAARAVVVVRP